jgi:hypothetical protein
LADVPGTKLYLLLNAAIRQGTPTGRQTESRHLVPMKLPPRLTPPSPKETFRLRIKREFFQLEVIWFRLRFHLTQGALYTVEAIRWKRRWRSINRFLCNEEQRRGARRVWRDPPRESPKISDTQ